MSEILDQVLTKAKERLKRQIAEKERHENMMKEVNATATDLYTEFERIFREFNNKATITGSIFRFEGEALSRSCRLTEGKRNSFEVRVFVTVGEDKIQKVVIQYCGDFAKSVISGDKCEVIKQFIEDMSCYIKV